ncbi:MAG: hypothetical protein JSR48_08195 [Verrucomicrobia bacterium]|nr:hypothetical protein [Verrucomicrobiota bacterium]
MTFALAATALGFAGCISSRYRMNREADRRPVPALNLPGDSAVVAARLDAVVVYRGPGSWKRDAYWDEYVVTVAGRGPGPVTVESATLTGRATAAVAPGTDPWALEKASRTLLARNFDLGKDVVVHLGGGFVVITGTATAAFTVAAATGAGWGSFGAAAVAGAVVAPVFVGASIYRNVSGKHGVEREFARRRLVLPATATPEHPAQGSLFFPITPGPRRLTLQGQADGQPFSVTIDLAALKDLHLKMPVKPEPVGQGK